MVMFWPAVKFSQTKIGLVQTISYSLVQIHDVFPIFLYMVVKIFCTTFIRTYGDWTIKKMVDGLVTQNGIFAQAFSQQSSLRILVVFTSSTLVKSFATASLKLINIGPLHVDQTTDFEILPPNICADHFILINIIAHWQIANCGGLY